jgi:hypothetical protein
VRGRRKDTKVAFDFTLGSNGIEQPSNGVLRLHMSEKPEYSNHTRIDYPVSLGDRLDLADLSSSDCLDRCLALARDDDSPSGTVGSQARSGGDSEHGGGGGGRKEERQVGFFSIPL